MSYDKDFYKKVIRFVKNFKKGVSVEEFESGIDLMFHKIEKEEELTDKGTSLVKLILDSKPLKRITIELEKKLIAYLIVVTVNEFECGLGICYELFGAEQEKFCIYDLSPFAHFCNDLK